MSARLYFEAIPMSVIEADCDGEMEVRFEWTPGTPETGRFGPPENYDPGSADEFYIVASFYVIGDGSLVPCGLSPHEEDRVIDYLDAEWERPDLAAERADYEYDRWRDEQMERRWEAGQ